MAHDGAVIPIEAAASLFGTDDEAATDFFVANFDSMSLLDGQTSSDHSSSLEPGSSAAANLFEAGPNENTSSLFSSTSPDSRQSVVDADHHPDHTRHQSQLPPNPSVHQSQNLQSEQEQWHDYSSQSGYTSTYDYASQQPHAQYSSLSYDHMPHSPDNVSHVSQSTSPPASLTGHSQRYTPQELTQNTHHHQSTYTMSYATPQNSMHRHNAYTPYPSISQANPITNVAPYGLHSVPSQDISGKKNVEAYRPTARNAYDPPVPTKTRLKSRSAVSNTSTSYTPFSDVRSQYTKTQSLPQPRQYAMDAVFNPPPSVSAEKTHNLEGVSRGITEESVTWTSATTSGIKEGSHETQQPSAAPLKNTDLLEPLDSNTPAPSQQGDFSHINAGALEERAANDNCEGKGPSYTDQGLLSFDPEGDATGSMDAVVATPVNESTYKSSPQQHHVYGLDDQPFGDGQNSVDGYMHPMMPPPPRTGPAAGSDTGTSRTSDTSPDDRPFRDHQTEDPYYPSHHSYSYSDVSHISSSYAVPERTSMTPYDPYAPSTVFESSRRSSTASTTNEKYDDGSHGASANGFVASREPYALPARSYDQNRHTDLSSVGDSSPYSYSNVSSLGHALGTGPTSDAEIITGPANILTAPTYAAYAPSPSLLGTNDPLGRAAARVPVISFGFGGKLVSCFHSAGETSGGYDVSLNARQSTDIQLRTLHEMIPSSAMDSWASSYPGPLFSDPGASSISLARTVGVGAAGNIKAKKNLVSKWLEERITEISSGVAYISSGSQERHNSEGRLVLVRLLKAMLDNDGQLSGSPSIEWSVRSALIPRLETEMPPNSADGLSSTDITAYSSALTDVHETPLAIYNLRASALDRIQEFLLRGERRQACHYALDEKLWAHAMLIASSIDNQTWKEVVKEFLHFEFAVKQQPALLPGSKSSSLRDPVNGRESLRVAYSLFAGYGAAAVQELIPPRVSAHKDAFLARKTALHATPLSPNFPQPALTSSVPPEALAKWHETAAVMAFSQTAGDSAALTALGDYLAASRWFEAAHACYLLSPRTSSLGGAGAPSVRIVLVGSESPTSLRNFSKDLDVTIFSEIVEFALSLCPAKGQESFGGLPHLQAYKLIRASHLAEMGHVEIANRYCEAIGSVIRASSRGSPFYTPTFIGELKNLSDRLTAAPQLDKTASWISSKLAKPSLDTIGSWLEGRFSKLIVGDGEGGQETELNEQKQPPIESYGPFSHYSTISSAATSASPSPSPTPHAANGLDNTYASPNVDLIHGNSQVQIDRASSAMDHLRPEVRRTSPVPRVASASATTTTFAVSNLSTRSHKGHGGSNVPENERANDIDGQEITWWGSNVQDRNGPTPTIATFYKLDEGQSVGNFVSLTDSYPQSISPTSSSPSQGLNKSEAEDVEEVEDLGLGNATQQTRKRDAVGSSEAENGGKSDGTEKLEDTDKSRSVSKPVEEKQAPKQQSTSWFGRWWNRGSEQVSSGPIKAKLGEETSFYYDKELKRWVNKKAGNAEAATPSPPPPPPSRPRTASPAPGGSLVTKATIGPPPNRPASAAEMAIPPRKPPRVRSNLVPPEESVTPGSAPPSATSFDVAKTGPGLAPPSGIGRPKSSASKRNVRSRYVDVFQQQSES